MRLQKQLSRKIGDKEYTKWVLVIPPSTIKKLGWNNGDKLNGRVDDGKLLIERQA